MDAAAGSNPYPGLRPFQAEETHLFFGRDQQRIELLHRLRRSRFLAIVGTSGSGKSSLVRAGLLPALHGGFMAGQAGRWRIADMRPGTDSIGNLARALDAPGVLRDEAGDAQEPSFTEATLRRSGVGLAEVVREARLPGGETLLVLVDQFEELFRGLEAAASPQAGDDAVAFVKLLLEAAKSELPIYVVLTMRSDFLGECSRFRDLPEAINDGQYLVPRLTPDQRAEAIVGPAAVFGVTLSSTLLNRLLNDVGDNPDQLPILQHALMRTWEQWRRRPANPIAPRLMALEDYEAIGGMASALSLHADAVFAALAPDSAPQQLARRQVIAERMFRCLAGVGAGGLAVRRLATLREVMEVSGEPLAEVLPVIEAFRAPGQSFLMPPAGEPLTPDRHLDISHESLIRNWGRMRGWVQEEAESARVYERLSATARLHSKGEAALWGQPDLGVALQWQAGQRPNPAWARRYNAGFDESMVFLRASRARAEAAEDAGGQRRRLWVFATVLVLFAMTTTILSWWRDEAVAIDRAMALSRNERVQLQGLRERFNVYRAQVRGDTAPDRERVCTGDFFGNSARSELFRLLCERGRPLTSAERQIVSIYEHVLEGRWSEAVQALSEVDGAPTSEDVIGLLGELATMRSPTDDADRNLLLDLRARPANAGALSEPGAALVAAIAHPVHRRIADVLIRADYDRDKGLTTLERQMLEAYAHAKAARGSTDGGAEALERGRGIEVHMRTLPNGNLYAGLVAIALAPEPQVLQNLRVARGYFVDNAAYLAVFLVWPVWRLRRFLQHRRGAIIGAKPHPLRRGAAEGLDLAVACGIGLFADVFARAVVGLAASLLDAEPSLGLGPNSDHDTSIGIMAGLLAASAYLLWRDAIKIRFRRSLGKAWLDLRPLAVDAAHPGAITLRRSARRNPVGAPLLLLAIPLLVLFSYVFYTSNMPAFDRALVVYAAMAGAAALFLLVDFWRGWSKGGQTFIDKWSRTRVVDADSAEALAVRP